MRYRIAIVLGFVLFVMGTLTAAAATPAHDGVCGPLDSGKIDVADGVQEVTITAPDGFLINEVCVKAGSANQGLGPIYEVIDPPVKTLVLKYFDPDGKQRDISHYSYGLTEVETTTTTTQPPETTTTTQPPETTTTTQPPETTTTTQPPETTTTTQPPETTTTTQPEVTTTTQPEVTTTTVPEETTTTTEAPEEPECNEDSTTWNEETQDCRLPFTGAGEVFLGLGMAALGMLMMGYGLIGSSRKRTLIPAAV